MMAENPIVDDPETYKEDGTQYIITSEQRRGVFPEKPVKYENLVENAHWLNEVREEYGRLDDLKGSGRIFNGSDIILANIESEQFKDPNQVYQSRYTIESSYIYVISKVIGANQYYKVGEGGSGYKTSGPGRLGDAQTFLPFGLNEDVGYRVHYVMFFPKRHHQNVEQMLSKFIETRIHANLRYTFRSASITFDNGHPSEWYLIPDNDLAIFLGFMFDIVSSYKIRPLEIWKLTSDKKDAKIVIKLNADWKERMKNNPNISERDNSINNIGTNIVIKHNYEEESGSVKLFWDNLKGPFYFKTENPVATKPAPMRLRKQNRPVIEDSITYNVIQIIKNAKKHGLGQPLQINRFYGIVTSSQKNFQTNLDDFLTKDINIFEIKLTAEEVAENNIKSKFYISIKDLLGIHKKMKTPADFRKWALRDIYNNYHNITTEGHEVETYEMPNNFLAPPWFFNTQIQLAWAVKMTREEEYKYHTDCNKIYSNNRLKYKWKTVNFFPPQFDGKNRDYVIERERTSDAGEIIKEVVPILRVMNAMSLNEIKPAGKKKKGQEESLKKDECKVHLKDHVEKPINVGDFIGLADDYFTYYKRNGEADDVENHKGKTVYAIKKVYRKTDHSDTLNPWIDIQQYPSTIDKRIWCILIPDFKDDALNGKLTIEAQTAAAIERLKTKLHAEEATADNNELTKELKREAAPKYKKGDVIRVKPNEFSTYRFGEDETKRDEYHYAEILKKVQDEGTQKHIQYEIAYFPPWDTNEIWGLTPERGKYKETHLISIIDKYSQKVKRTDEDFKTYCKNLKGKYTIQSIYDYSPKNNQQAPTSHAEFIADAENQNEDAVYYVRWEGYGPDVDNEVMAIGLYEDVPGAVNEFWARQKPFSKKMTTRADTRKKQAAQGGGRRKTKRGGSCLSKKKAHFFKDRSRRRRRRRRVMKL